MNTFYHKQELYTLHISQHILDFEFVYVLKILLPFFHMNIYCMELKCIASQLLAIATYYLRCMYNVSNSLYKYCQKVSYFLGEKIYKN